MILFEGGMLTCLGWVEDRAGRWTEVLVQLVGDRKGPSGLPRAKQSDEILANRTLCLVFSATRKHNLNPSKGVVEPEPHRSLGG